MCDQVEEHLRINPGEGIPRLLKCPECGGRGWFLINPFATGGSKGAGGSDKMPKCETVVRAKDFWDAKCVLPPDGVERIEAKGKGANDAE